MIFILVALLALVVVGALYLSKMRRDNGGQVPEEPCDMSVHSCSGCCGGTDCFHAKIKNKPLIVYFEDEELDRYRGRNGEDYSEAELDEWREVMETLRPEELQAWLRSISLRRLHIPKSLLSEVESRIPQEA